jgi:hypothetical protein
MIDPSVISSYVLNSLILALIFTVPLLIGQDARRRGLSWTGTVVWALVSLALFPIGVGLYLLFGRPSGWPDAANQGRS